jgi:hypothetical protein
MQQQKKIFLGFTYTRIELILARTLEKEQGVARRKRKRKGNARIWGVLEKEKKFNSQIRGVTLAHLPSLICALCLALSPSLSLCPHEPRAPPPPTDTHRLFCGRHCARAPSSATVSFALMSATRDTLRCALSLSLSSGPRALERFLVQPESTTVALSSPCASAVVSRRQR